MIDINLPDFSSEIHFQHSMRFHSEMLKKSIRRMEWLFAMIDEKCSRYKEDVNDDIKEDIDELKVLANKVLSN